MTMLAGEESSLAPLPFPNLGASTASVFISPELFIEIAYLYLDLGR